MRAPDPAFERHCRAVRERLAASGLRRAGPGSVTWTINREILVVAGWGRAILLQLAHPLVAAGVAQHSSFNQKLSSSFARLFSTVGAMLSLTFGDEDEAVRAAAGINLIHDRVFGRLATDAGLFVAGTPYSAHQSDLLRWVHLTLLESVPMTYELLVGPLSIEERDQYCAEAAVVEPLLDIPAGMLPRRWSDVAPAVSSAIELGAVAVTGETRELGRAVLYPRGSAWLWPAFRPLRLITIGLLPPAIRRDYGFGWTRADERALQRWTRAIRLARQLTPPPLREWRAARRPADPNLRASAHPAAAGR